MIYSLEERKVGSYFGEDLYEKCFNYSDFVDNALAIENADKIINVSGFILTTDSEKIILPTGINAFTSQYTLIKGLSCYCGDNITGEEPSPAYVIIENRGNTIASGIIKVQYTKL